MVAGGTHSRFESSVGHQLKSLNPKTMDTQSKLTEAQAINTCRQITRLIRACAISEEDFTDVVWQEHKGSLFFDFKVYDTTPELQFHLGAFLGGAFGAASINTMACKSTNKYRGYIRYEIQTTIKNAK